MQIKLEEAKILGWEQVTSMDTKRYGMGAAVYGDVIVVAGAGIYRTPGLLAPAISVFLVDNRRAILVS